MPLRRTFALLALGFALPAASASSQTIGTFRWQLRPYCNVLILTVTQQGAIYTLDGTDDRCGGGNQAGSAVGIAHLTPLGQVGFGITSVLANGTPVHTEATIDLASLSGTWRDSAGNTGSLVFTPGTPVAGAPRPISTSGVPPASITNVQIANNSVTSANILDASITIADLADAPRAAFAGGDQNVTLSATDVVVRSVSIAAPAAGRVIVNASGYFSFSPTTADTARCMITTGSSIDFEHLIIAEEDTAAAMGFVPFAGTRGFAVAAGSHTFNLVCDLFAGTGDVRDTSMTATFIPGS